MKAGPLGRIGRSTLNLVGGIGALTHLGFRTTYYLLRGSLELRSLIVQMEAIGYSSLPLVVITVTFAGMVMAIYTAGQLQDTGTANLLGGLIAVSIVRELGPVLTGIVAAAQAGSAIAAEVGTMKVTEQIDALRSLATDPVEYLVVPRYGAALLSLPLLTVVADLCGIMGGLIVSLWGYEVAPGIYLDSVRVWTKLGYFTSGLVKALVFGAIIALVGSYQGFRTGQGSAAVGQSTTRAVVMCVLLIYVADFFLTWVFT